MKDKNDIPRAINALNGMKGKIKGLIDLEVGIDFLMSERSYDIGLICTLKNKAALIYYQDHEIHRPVKELMAMLRESSVAVDYEY